MWRKARRNKVAWATLRGNGLPPPFETVDAVRLTTRGFILEGEAAQQVTSLCGIDDRNFAQKEHFGEGEGEVHVSLDRRVEVLFLLLINLAQYVVDGTTASGQAAVRRSGVLSERFRVVAQRSRTFHEQNARVAASKKFQPTFVKYFIEDLQLWAEEVTRRGLLLEWEPRSSFSGPRKVGPMPLLPFTRTYTCIQAAPIQLVHTGGSARGR